MYKSFDIADIIWADVSNNRQPKLNFPISNNPIASDLVAFANPAIQFTSSLKRPATISGNATRNIDNNGYYWQGASTNSPVHIGATGGLDTVLDKNRPWSIATRIYIGDITTTQEFIGDMNSTGTARGVELIVDAGSLSAAVYGTTNSTATYTLPGVGIYDVLMVSTGGTGFTVSLYINGFLVSTGSAATGVQVTGASLRLMNPGLYIAAAGALGKMYYCAFFQEDKSVYARALAINPWQLISNAQDNINFAQPASGLALGSGNLASSSLGTISSSAIGTAAAFGSIAEITASVLTVAATGTASSVGDIGGISLTTIDGTISTTGNASTNIANISFSSLAVTAIGEGNALGDLSTLSLTAVESVAFSSGFVNATIAEVALSTCTATAYSDVVISSNIATSSLSTIVSNGYGSATSSATVVNVTLGVIIGTASVIGEGAASGSLASSSLTSLNANIANTANISCNLPEISFSPITGIGYSNGYVTSAIIPVNLNSPEGIGYQAGEGLGTGSFAESTLNTPNGVGSVSNTGIGEFNILSLGTVDGIGYALALATGIIAPIVQTNIQGTANGTAAVQCSFYNVYCTAPIAVASSTIINPTIPNATIKMQVQTDELVQMTLKIAGEILTFNTFSILGMPSFSVDRLYSSEVTNYTVEQQDWNIHCSSLDCSTYNIKDKDNFTITDTTYRYTFKLNSNPIPYDTGWSKCRTNLIGKVAL